VTISLVNDKTMGHSEFSPRNSQRGMGRGINDRRDFFSLGCFFQRMAYTSEEFRLRVSKDRLRVTTRLKFRTCFAKQTVSIVMSRRSASCRFRLEILLSYQVHQRDANRPIQWGYTCMIYALLLSKYPSICTVGPCSAIIVRQRPCIFTEWPP
jgi:hypothetical protein